MDKTKERIIADVLIYLDDLGNLESKGMAKNNLLLFAKQYNVKIVRKVFRDKKKALIDFILNERGYIDSVNNLYNALQ